MQIRTSKKEKLYSFFSKINKRIIGVVVLALILLGGGITYYFVTAASQIPGTTVSTNKASTTKLYFGENGNDKYTYRYNVTYTAGTDSTGASGKSYEAVCAETDKKTPHGRTSAVYDLSADVSEYKYEAIKRILLTTYIGRNYKLADGTTAYNTNGTVYDWGRYSKYANNKGFATTSVALGHVLVSYVYSGSTTGFGSSFASNFWAGDSGLVRRIYNIFENEPYKSLAASVVVRRSEGTSEYQDLIWLEGVPVEDPEGELWVQKSSSDPGTTNGNSFYQLNNAVFEVFREDQCTGSMAETDSEDEHTILEGGVCSGTPVATLTTGMDGKTGTVTLPIGYYYVKEKTQPQGFKINSDIFGTSIVDGDTTWLEVEDDPVVGGVKIKKVDSETLAITPLGGASLAGTKYSIYDLTNWTTVTEDVEVGSDGYATYEGLSPGLYKIKENVAGTGYKINEDDFLEFTVTGSNEIIDLSSTPFKDEVMRGDVKFTKRAEDYNCKSTPARCETLGGIPFVIENTDTGEKHVIVADDDGVVSTKAVNHSTNTNANDGLMSNSYGTIVSGGGVWFSGTTSTVTAANNSKGALPYGNYKITELRTSDNEAYKLFEGSTTISFSITSDGQFVDLDTIDTTRTYVNKLVDEPVLGTTATAADGSSKQVDIGEKVKLKDRISYSGLSAGKKYSVVVELVDKSRSTNNEAYRTIEVYDDDGGKSSSIEIKDLTAGSGGSGTWDIEVEFDSKDFIGQDVVFFEELYRGDILIGIHKELNDSGQTVTVKKPEILSTVATTNTADNSAKTVGAGVNTVYDKVTLKGLVKNGSYTIKTTAKLDDGTAIKLIDGESKVDSVSNTITYEKTTGVPFEYWVTLNIDTATYAGKKIIIYQQLIGEENYGTWPNSSSSSDEIAAETITVLTPEMGTVAFDGNSGAESDKEIKISSAAKIRDKIHYKNLVNGTSYYLTGKVVDKNGNVIAHAEENTLVKKEASGGEGDWYLDFTVDTRRYNGQEMTVYEYLYADSAGSSLILEHAEGTLGSDASKKVAQTVSVAVVSIETTAWVGSEGVKEAGVGKVTVSDTVKYVGLTNGDSYKLSGELVLVEKEGENYVEKAKVAEKVVTFTAETNSEAEGSKAITFENINTSKYIGKTLVVKEVLYPDKTTVTEDDIIAEHTELGATSQTIMVKTPTIETLATSDGVSGKEVEVKKDLKIYDKIKISGLVKGESYTVIGLLRNTTDNSDISVSAFKKAGASEAASPFTVTNDDGSYEGLFEFTTDTRSLIEKEITVQEWVYYTLGEEENEVVKHTDKTTEQTVRVKKPEIRTYTRDGISNTEGDREIGVGEAKIIDKVIYQNLAQDQKYKLVAVMKNRETGEDVGCTGEKEFTGTNGEGSVEVEISCNTKALVGKKLVAFEKLYIIDEDEEEEIGKHEDLEDEEQFIDVSNPEIGTIATAETKAYDDEKIVDNLEEAKIKDKVRYSGLSLGSRYKVVGVLYDKATGEKLLINDEEVTAEYVWTADKENDTEGVEIIFELDTASEGLPGKKLVAFEKLYLLTGDEEVEIATHEKIDSEDQSVEVKPRVGTKVVDKIDNDQAVGIGKAEVVDTVSYEGLKTGRTYLLRGVMMDKKTGMPLKQTLAELESENVEGETIFTIGEEGYENESGEVKVEFTFETDQIQGKELVVFEKLYELETVGEETNEILRTEHEDLEDAAQLILVKMAGIGTHATDKSDGDKELEISDEVEVDDKVEYRGLIKGEKYKLVGNLVDKENPKISLGYSEAEFVAEAENGEYTLTFTINTKDMSGKEIVAFERLYYINDEEKEVEIAKHEDLDDQAQTVWVKVMTPNTGIFGAISDKGAVERVSLVAVFIGALGAVYAVLVRKRKIRF